MLITARRSLGPLGRALKEAVDLADAPRRKLYGPVTDVLTDERAVALTFDDGPNPVYTPRLLDVLQRYGTKATFFMLGRAARAHPEVVEAVANAGHAIGNHSYSHCDFRSVTSDRRRQEIRDCSQSLRGFESKIFRPPYGSENMASHFDARTMGYTVVKWTVSVGDWEQVPSATISERIVQQIRPGAIVLLHDSIATHPHADRSAVVDAVECLLQVTAGEYVYHTIPELFRLGRLRTSFHSIEPTLRAR
jgi:peptidoglycan/xylan/chitin deacetylase (PgdA/CDA1 family)